MKNGSGIEVAGMSLTGALMQDIVIISILAALYLGPIAKAFLRVKKLFGN